MNVLLVENGEIFLDVFKGHSGTSSIHSQTLSISANLLVALGFTIALGAFLSIDQRYGGFLVLLASIPAGLGYLLGCAIASLVWLVRCRWLRANASAMKIVVFTMLIGPCLRSGDYVHLALFYPAYAQEIRTHGADNLEPVRLDWGDKALWVTDGFQGETLVSDPTDALAATIDDVRCTDREGFGLATRQIL